MRSIGLLTVSIVLMMTANASGKSAEYAPNLADGIQHAIFGAKYLYEHSREPDSFRLVIVYLKPNKGNHPPNICFRYTGKNGFGGYSAGQAVMKPTKETYSYPYDPDDIYGGEGFFRLDCNAKKAVDITDQVQKGLEAK